MDDDDLRRGRPTCHIAFGENVAILAATAFAEAYRLILDQQRGEPERVLSAPRAVAGDKRRGMGGVHIIAATSEFTPEELRHMHELKTA